MSDMRKLDKDAKVALARLSVRVTGELRVRSRSRRSLREVR